MDPIKKKLWIDALRSGKYRKGVGVLNRNDRYCCMGVLCEVAIENGCRVNKVKDIERGTINYDGCTAFVPQSVINWGKLRENVTYIVKGAVINLPGTHVAYLNDSERKSFNEIADLIEQYL